MFPRKKGMAVCFFLFFVLYRRRTVLHAWPIGVLTRMSKRTILEQILQWWVIPHYRMLVGNSFKLV